MPACSCRLAFAVSWCVYVDNDTSCRSEVYLQFALCVGSARSTHLGNVGAGASVLALDFPCKVTVLELCHCHVTIVDRLHLSTSQDL